MYNDFYNTNLISTTGVDFTWTVVSVVLAIVGGLAVYAVFVAKKDNKEYDGFLNWLHGFLNFKTFFIETILKVLYIICAIFITLSSFSCIRVSIAQFFMVLIFGNLFARIAFEMILMFTTLVSNTTEINKKLDVAKKETATKPKKKEDN